MMQAIRTLIDWDNGFLNGKRYLPLDRDAKYSEAFRFMLTRIEVEPVRLPPRSPNLNSHIERIHKISKRGEP
jgi:putative transposase